MTSKVSVTALRSVLVFTASLILVGCIEGTCDWYGCDDLGEGFCVWYEGQRADVVYVKADVYAESGCNVNSASSVVSNARAWVLTDSLVLLNEYHVGNEDYPPGHGSPTDLRRTGTYHWIIDKRENEKWRWSGFERSFKPHDAAVIGPLDSLRFIWEAWRMHVDQVSVDSLIRQRQ